MISTTAADVSGHRGSVNSAPVHAPPGRASRGPRSRGLVQAARIFFILVWLMTVVLVAAPAPVAAATSANLVETPTGGTVSFSASSTFSTPLYAASKVGDGSWTTDGGTWATAGCPANASVTITWTVPQEVNWVQFWPRMNDGWGTETRVTLSDGSIISGTHSASGAASEAGNNVTLTFAVRHSGISWVKIEKLTGGGGNCGLAEVRVFNDGEPAPSATPTPTGAPGGPDGDGSASPWPREPGEAGMVEETQCEYRGTMLCGYGRYQLGMAGVEEACLPGYASPYKDADDRYWISCPSGIGAPTAGDKTFSTSTFESEHVTYLVGYVYDASSLAVLFDYGAVGGPSWTCYADDASAMEGSASGACEYFPELGDVAIIIQSGGKLGAGGGWRVIGPSGRQAFAKGQPGGVAAGYDRDSYKGPEPGYQWLDTSSPFRFALPVGYDGPIYLRVRAQPSPVLSEASRVNQLRLRQEMVGVPIYAALPYDGWWASAGPAPNDDGGAPPGWDACFGTGNPAIYACAGFDQFAEIPWGADSWPDCGGTDCVVGDGGGFSGGQADGGSAVACDITTGECTIYANFCTTPTVALDAPGWLSFIACQVGNIPGMVGGVIHGLFVPGPELGEDFARLTDSMNEKVPFGWFDQVSGTISTSMAASAGSLPELQYDYGDGSVDVGAGLADAMAGVAGYRGLLLAGVALVMVLGCLRWIMAAVGVSPSRGAEE